MIEIKNRWTGQPTPLPDDCPRGSVWEILEWCARCQREGRSVPNLRGADLRGVNLCGVDLRGVDLCDADLRGVDLRGVDLRDADLRFAALCDADLRDADLRFAALCDADLRGVDLRFAALRGVNLRGVNLCDADLRGVDLRGVDLRGVNLRGVDLRGVDLRGVDLRGVNLCGVDLCDVDLCGTIIDPAASLVAPTDDEITAAGLDVCVVRGRRRIYGYRTATSQHVGSTEYTPRRWHVAPYFSVDAGSECHPGIYFGSREWLGEKYCADLVRCWAYADETVHAGDKWRARRIYVLAEEPKS